MGPGWPATSPERVSTWSRSTGPTARPAGAGAKSDSVDAEVAARAVLNGEATVVPKAQGSLVESIRVLRVAFTSARDSRTRVALQIRDLIVTAPDQLRTVLGPLSTAERVARAARFQMADDIADPVLCQSLPVGAATWARRPGRSKATWKR
jgi:hypothetical protein